MSSEEFPNLVEPDSNITDDVIYSVLNSCAVIVPVTVKLPVKVSVVFNRYELVAAVNDAISLILVAIDDELVVTLLDRDAEAAVFTAISLASDALNVVD